VDVLAQNVFEAETVIGSPRALRNSSGAKTVPLTGQPCRNADVVPSTKAGTVPFDFTVDENAGMR